MVKYFAYGSNLSPQEMGRITDEARFYAVARLPDHALEFTYCSKWRQGGVADVVPRPGSDVWGVVYELPESALTRLDRKEGVPRAYRRVIAPVETEKGTTEDVALYLVVEKQGKFRPRPEYKHLIVQGAKHWGLPQSYTRFLEAIPTDT